mgnify:CR=1 FL=1
MHEGHRDRLRNKLIKYGADSLEKHEILELLLYYAVPRRNTNDIAHRLIDAFGSISGIMDAPMSSLVDVDGIGEKSAVLLKLIPVLTRLYTEDKYQNKDKIMNEEKIHDIIEHKFIGRENENIALMLMDSKMKLLFFGIVNEGNANSVDMYISKIISLTIKYSAVYAVIAHNHPSGIALPSTDDIATTRELSTALKLVSVRLLDHIIVADDDSISLHSSGLCDDAFWFF